MNADFAVRFLNRIFKLDPVTVTALVNHRVVPNQAIEDDPFVIVLKDPGEPAQVGITGIINGLIQESGGQGCVAGVYDTDTGQLIEFSSVE